MKRYNPLDIEPKWQKFWDENQTYKADLDSDQPKYFSMSMFNYPSGAGIHIGHAMNYTISDVMARFKRQQGYESYHPVGWDAFGLPAENFAIKTGVSPQQSMKTIIPGYHTQYKAMGWSNDWSKEIATHEPEYYKWTQWIFAQMFKQGLAYQDSRMQWWCDKDKTVLSNEQVIDGKCWRHDGADDPLVEKKEIKQWFFKITEYADELLEATDALDWTETVKLAQKNWIGKSQGAEVDFAVKDSAGKIRVFTTRPDTLYGATFLVLAPEHPSVAELTTDEQRAEVDKYVAETGKKSELERMETKEKTGVFTGSYAINPLTGAEIPVWIADYVLYGYGTGAIMAVPAHDERDREFADKFELPAVEVIDAEDNMINSGEFDGLNSSDAREKIVAKLEGDGIGEAKTTFKLRDWSVSRQRYWGAPIPIINCPTDGPVLVPDDSLPVVLPELKDFAPAGDGRSALARADEWLHVACPKCGGEAERETDTLDTYICSSWYYLRYLDPHNSELPVGKARADKWMPVDFYNGGDHATAHMIYARFVTRFLHKIGIVNNPEPFKRFLFNGKVTAANGEMFSKSKGNGVDPLEIINSGYGADALRTYLMFAAPLDLWMRWDEKGVPGTYKFINRVWNLVQEFAEAKPGEASDAVLKVVHPAIRKATADLEDQKYNTAIAAMMKLTNDLYDLKAKDAYGDRANWQFALDALVAMVAPFAPHAAEEMWHQLGHDTTVHRDSWPQWDDKYLVADEMTIVVQVNGKLRAELKLPQGTSDDDVKSAALEPENVVRAIGDGQVLKTIYIPGKLVNLVVK
ncbi:leucine--tRNA ligase [Candidatus Saccharibacteria bacterium]|nr:leucine--tRNA ligase [Candidatus Saccharibacteria bacterium]